MIENINLNGATVSAELHGFMYNNVWGYTGVFKYGSGLGAEIVSNNEIKIKDGLLCNYGRFMRISGYESIAIENGTSGVIRQDLIVAHFETDGINEIHDLRVLKGVAGGKVPTYIQGDIYNGDLVNEIPLYKVKMNGLTLEKATPMFTPLLSFDELRNNFSNPNLLINSDFRNPINQRGSTSYSGISTGRVYTIDRWSIYGAGQTVNVADGYIEFINDSAPGNFIHLLEKSLISGETYTISANINGSIVTKTITGGTYDTSGELMYGATGSYEYIGIHTNAGVTNKLYWIKIEQGTVATPFVPRLYDEEYLLCQRYYQMFSMLPIYGLSSSATTFFGLKTNVKMRTNPTFNLKSVYDSSATAKSITLKSQSSNEYNIVNIALNSSLGTQYGYITYSLDAEIY